MATTKAQEQLWVFRKKIMGMTQHEFADWVGVSQNCVGYWERGTSPVPATVLRIIDEHFAWLSKLDEAKREIYNLKRRVAVLTSKLSAARGETAEISREIPAEIEEAP